MACGGAAPVTDCAALLLANWQDWMVKACVFMPCCPQDVTMRGGVMWTSQNYRSHDVEALVGAMVQRLGCHLRAW